MLWSNECSNLSLLVNLTRSQRCLGPLKLKVRGMSEKEMGEQGVVKGDKGSDEKGSDEGGKREKWRMHTFTKFSVICISTTLSLPFPNISM